MLISDRAVSTANKGPLDPLEVAQGPDAILGRIFGYYAGILKEPESQPQDPPKSQAQQIVEREQRFTLFWKYLTRQDHHSMRSYLLTTVRLDEATVEWLETNSSGTGLYNLAFVEMVMDGIDFGRRGRSRDQETPAHHASLDHRIQGEGGPKSSMEGASLVVHRWRCGLPCTEDARRPRWRGAHAEARRKNENDWRFHRCGRLS